MILKIRVIDTHGDTGSVFGSDERLESVAADWLQRYEQHEANAVAEITNFVLRSAGCDIGIDGNDVLDTDNAPNKLMEIQDEFQMVAMTSHRPYFTCAHFMKATASGISLNRKKQRKCSVPENDDKLHKCIGPFNRSEGIVVRAGRVA